MKELFNYKHGNMEIKVVERDGKRFLVFEYTGDYAKVRLEKRHDKKISKGLIEDVLKFADDYLTIVNMINNLVESNEEE